MKIFSCVIFINYYFCSKSLRNQKILYPMNKLFTTFIFLSLFSNSFLSKAQDTTLLIYNANGAMIENGSSLAAIATNATAKLIFTDSLLVKNNSEETINIKVRRIDQNLVEGCFSVFSALAQNMSADETITPNVWELAAGETLPKEAVLKGTYYSQSIIGTSNIIYSFLSVDENDVVLDSVYVCYSFSNTSITPLNSDGNYLYNKEIFIDCDPSEINEYPILLHNHTNEAVSYRVSKTVLESEIGHDVYFKYGGVEYSVDDVSSEASGVSIAADDTLQGDNGFYAILNPHGVDGNEVLTKVRYKFFNRMAGNDADFVTLVYNPSGVGFSELENYQISEPYPNPASEYVYIDHNIPDDVQAEIKLYNAAGQLILIDPIAKNSSKSIIRTTTLQYGVYFVSIEIDGQAIGTEKLMIQ